jgi:hypothetical protein
MKKLIVGIFGTVITVITINLLALIFPQPFFVASAKAGNLTIYSDRPFSAAAGERILNLSIAKLATSPLYSNEQKHSVFVSNSPWRRIVFLTRAFYAGGINYYPLTTNVFLRPADIEANQLFGPSGNRLAGARTLDYFIVHEITHSLTGQSLGAIDHYLLPRWKREGYADYLGRHGAFNFEEARRALLANDPRMDYQRSGLYWRDHLFVAYLLDICGWTVQKLLLEPIDEQAIEQIIRGDSSNDTSQAMCTNLLS